MDARTLPGEYHPESMQVHFGVASLVAEWKASVACVGTFDGVHLGHRAVIERAVARAREREEPAVLVTFDRHPAATLAPDRCPPTVAPLEANLAAFERLGVALAVVMAFDRAMSETPAQTFLDDVLVAGLGATSLVVGRDFGFGRGREGNAEWLAPRIPTEVVPPFLVDGVRASSTGVRQTVLAGDVETAARLLGRPFEVAGVVVSGRKLGRELGYPTANLARSVRQVVPKDGVYAGIARTAQGTFRAAIGVGVRPTVTATPERTIEAFLLDYRGDSLYGSSLSLAFVRRLRDEERFPNLDVLAEQMGRDVARTRDLVVL
ncbi:MAG: riboflavin biosynthesis protein RibF [Fimbriimonadaceae bacterium]|nr:riboflavin biosynthesis protein RibF [Fimbriimonadaceae bacterium]